MPNKKDPYSSSGQKVLGLYALLLFTGRSYSLPQLAELFHCSKQTILRLMEEIDRHHRLEVDSWHEGGRKWYRARPLRRRPNVTLSVEDIQQLLLCRDVVRQLLPEDLGRRLGEAVEKTAVLLPDYETREDALESITHFQPKGMVDYSGHQEAIETLLRAIRERRVCDIVYHAPEWKRSHSLAVAPYRFIVFREAFYVQCRPETALNPPVPDQDRTLAVHRMTSVALTEKRFNPITDGSITSGDAFGLAREAPFQVVVDFVPKAAMYVRERIWSRDQVLQPLPGGGVRLSFTAASRPEVLAWVLSFGGEAVLHSPSDIRAELCCRLQEMMKGHAQS